VKAKVAFVVGVGLGGILGMRAGRGQYDRMKSWVLDIWDDPRVQEYVQEAQDQATRFVAEQGTALKDRVWDAATSPADRSAG
jgi:hypothetical protein